jgi:monooxygenase
MTATASTTAPAQGIGEIQDAAYVFGYFRHSWTLRVDLVSDLVGRLLANMQEKGATMVVPTLRPQDTDMQLRPWSDPVRYAGRLRAVWPAT